MYTWRDEIVLAMLSDNNRSYTKIELESPGPSPSQAAAFGMVPATSSSTASFHSQEGRRTIDCVVSSSYMTSSVPTRLSVFGQ